MFSDDSLIPWVGKTGKMIGSVMNKIFKEENICLTLPQFIVLNFLSLNEGKPQHDLAFITESNKTSLSRLISNMEKSNLIVRKSTKEDKRVKNIYITSYGKSVLESTTPIVKNQIKKFQIDISEQEIKTCISTLKKLQSNLGKEHSFKL